MVNNKMEIKLDLTYFIKKSLKFNPSTTTDDIELELSYRADILEEMIGNKIKITKLIEIK